ncbi:MAG: hypothetical protein Q4A69_06365 [Moraxella sp.]|nr:hypothetical protein [Moraxella sp.]
MTLLHASPIHLKHIGISENQIQDIIAKNPTILGLGDLSYLDRERRHTNAGRLDVLLQDTTNKKRFEVEIQLGKMDESHIIRTIEYWDIERKRYPQYKHVAVIIAEDITQRFFNVLQLFNGSIPLIALKMSAYQFENKTFLTFTKVLDEMVLGFVDDDETKTELADRTYWEARGTKETMTLLDKLFASLKDAGIDARPKYNKSYIGIEIGNGQIKNFVLFRVRRSQVIVELKLEQSEILDEKINNLFDTLDYSGRYRIFVTVSDFSDDHKKDVLKQLMKDAYDEFK